MNATPGKSLTVTITPTNINNVTVTVNGNSAGTSVVAIGDGSYEITIDGDDIECPGPILIKEGDVILKTIKIDC